MKGNAHAEPASRQPPPTMALPLPQNKQKVRFGKKCVLRNVKNEGASGDVYENKGTGKFEWSLPYPGRRGVCQHESISRSRTRVPFPVPLSTKMKVHPAMCMKTKGLENSNGHYHIRAGGVSVSTNPFPDLAPVSRFPYPAQQK
jgi:hypothetical protein